MIILLITTIKRFKWDALTSPEEAFRAQACRVNVLYGSLANYSVDKAASEYHFAAARSSRRKLLHSIAFLFIQSISSLLLEQPLRKRWNDIVLEATPVVELVTMYVEL